MLKKTTLLVIILSLVWSQGIVAEYPNVNSTTIVFKSDASMSVSPSTTTKQKYCSMTEHAGNSSCSTATPSDHPISTSWDPTDRKVTITIQANVAGYGQAKASITSGSSGIGVSLLNLGGDVMNVGSWGGGTLTGEASADPTAYTASHVAYFFCPPDVEPDDYTWIANGKVEIWGVDWEGTGTVEVTTTVGVELGLSPAGTYQVGVGVASSVTDDVSGNASDRLKSDTDSWTVAHDSVCGHSQCGASLTDNPHAHHSWCPNDNGCGVHIPCKDYIPDEHKLHASCWNVNNGCSETNVRRCTHNCAYEETILCARELCGEIVSDPNEHYIPCGTQDASSAPSCGQRFWSCVQTTYDRHKPRSCDKSVKNNDGTFSECSAFLRNCEHTLGPHTQFWETYHHSYD